jgi:choline transport protein
LVFTATILAMQPQKQSSDIIWTSYTEVSSWSAGVQFLIVLSAPAIAFCPIDGAVHLVEEVKSASRVVPYTLMTSLVVSFVTSLAFALASLYCVTDFDAFFVAPSHFPFYEIWRQATSTTIVPLIFTIVTMLLLPVGSVACFQVSSMLTLSLGRDNGLLFSSHLAKVNTKLNTPV